MLKGNAGNIRDLILVLTAKEIKVRYKNNLLGYLWSIANPLAYAFVFYIAFKIVMRIQMPDYSLFLISALFPWQWFANSVNSSPSIFLGNASIVKKVNFSRSIIPLAAVLQDMFHFLLSIPVIVLFLFIYGKTPSLAWLYGIPLLLVVQLFMTYGISLFVSSMNLFFRDLSNLIVIFTTFIFYFTPIIYPERMVPEKYSIFIKINPLAPLMISWRNLFLDGRLDISCFALTLLYGILVFLAGYAIFRKLSLKFAEVL